MSIDSDRYKSVDTGSNRKKLLSELHILKDKYESTHDDALLDVIDSKIEEFKELFIRG